jgi:hypothetical protein
MESIQEKFERLNTNVQLLNATVLGINIALQELVLTIEITFKCTNSTVKIKFLNVYEYGFYYQHAFSFYDVADYKFLVTPENEIYLALDPDVSNPLHCSNDQDFVLAKDFDVVVVNDTVPA